MADRHCGWLAEEPLCDTPLDLAQGGEPGLETGALLDLDVYQVADAAQAGPAEGVVDRRWDRHRPVLGYHPIGHDHQGRETALVVSALAPRR